MRRLWCSMSPSIANRQLVGDRVPPTNWRRWLRAVVFLSFCNRTTLDREKKGITVCDANKKKYHWSIDRAFG